MTERTPPRGLGTILAILRIIRHLSQSELAEAAGITNSAVSDYERGKVDPQTATLRKVMGALSLPLSVLDDTQTFIDHIEHQVGQVGALAATPDEAEDLASREMSREIALLAAEGGRFLSRFIRVLFLVLSGLPLREPRVKRHP